MEYTVVGSTVNIASRIEALNKTFKTDILITEQVYEKTKDIEFEIIVVDNQSSSFNPQEFKNLFPNINLIIRMVFKSFFDVFYGIFRQNIICI